MIGSDLDGGFGNEQCPSDLNTIADLQKLDNILSKRGYSENDIQNILSKNGISFLLKNLPN
jgi:membrane dipeptidase